MADQTKTFEILADNQELLDIEIERINKRARKIGVPEVGYEVLDEYVIETPSRIPGNPPIIHKYLVVKPVGEPVCVAGWLFIARIEHHPSGTNLIHHAPGEYEDDLPERFRTIEPICEHCKVNRYRKDTFLLASDEDGRFLQVGRTCLKDFFGHNPETALKKISFFDKIVGMLGDAEEPGFRGAKMSEWTGTKDYLAYVCKAVRLDGWCSRAAAKETPGKLSTSGVAWDYMHPHSSLPSYERTELQKLDEADMQLAKDAIEWIRSLPKDNRKSDFMHNLFTLCSLEYIGRGHLGIVASLIACYKRVKGQEARRKEMATKTYFGTVGKREEFVLTLVGEHSFDGPSYNGYNYSTRWLLRFQDSAGNIATWWTDKSGIMFGLRIGEEAKVKATVKKHEEYKGIKQTVLTRCTLVEVLEEA